MKVLKRLTSLTPLFLLFTCNHTAVAAKAKKYEYHGSDLIKQDYYSIKEKKKFKYNLYGYSYKLSEFKPNRNNFSGYSWPDKNYISYAVNGTPRQKALTNDCARRINKLHVVKLTPNDINPDIKVHFVDQSKIDAEWHNATNYSTSDNCILGLTVPGYASFKPNRYASQTLNHVDIYVNKNEKQIAKHFNTKETWQTDYENEAILIHEFGHALGLDHSKTPSDLMSSDNGDDCQINILNHTQIIDQDFFDRLKTLYTN
ncbi:matrixin family metalloprotease [Lactobacillus sp. ESL0731]|uniref:matrixin family metalloprotease n=1 Tax=unclassified Lactobacillus TaxID=2620435 RepID=UPI0023F65B46|nr:MULTISPECIES: matrixin family metalloprotease [unclassified Lactobacillus]WEV50614.1 matrixin family metalloprotease [Lactobacillus sp. ESL0700]WEV61744.1 matrixin family metalloprotease [Lactobacillus sp. ESL0731]